MFQVQSRLYLRNSIGGIVICDSEHIKDAKIYPTKSLRNLVRLTTFKKGSKQTETHRRTAGINSIFWFPGGGGRSCFDSHDCRRILIILQTVTYSNIFRIQVIYNERIICLSSTSTELCQNFSLQSGYIIDELSRSLHWFLLKQK